ncbi:MAG: hypothetical protein JJU19_15385, partial [Pararhodobacter sp.]|nr:hypothetical protein [Pararhodobacter sp.]
MVRLIALLLTLSLLALAGGAGPGAALPQPLALTQTEAPADVPGGEPGPATLPRTSLTPPRPAPARTCAC